MVGKTHSLYPDLSKLPTPEESEARKRERDQKEARRQAQAVEASVRPWVAAALKKLLELSDTGVMPRSLHLEKPEYTNQAMEWLNQALEERGWRARLDHEYVHHNGWQLQLLPLTKKREETGT